MIKWKVGDMHPPTHRISFYINFGAFFQPEAIFKKKKKIWCFLRIPKNKALVFGNHQFFSTSANLTQSMKPFFVC